MTVSEIFKQTYIKLKQVGLDQPHLEASWIIEKFAQLNSVQRIQEHDRIISDKVTEKIYEATDRRLKGEPLAYILGEKDFYGQTFYVNSNVLIPRPETEILVDWALTKIEHIKKKKEEISILDLGGGSGCIGLSILLKSKNTVLTYIDLSLLAVEVAKKNAELMGLSHRVEFLNMNAADAAKLVKTYDLVVANPPYIDHNDTNIEDHVKKFEPAMALFSPQGTTHISQWLKALVQVLAVDGAVGIEIGLGQADEVTEFFNETGSFSKVYAVKDYAEIDRFICGESLLWN